MHSRITEKLTEYIQLITWYASQRDELLTLIRLVKFLYLLDLYYARENQGKILTGCPWRFVYYGPYCSEAIEAIKHAEKKGLIEAIPFKSKYDYEEHYLFSCPSDEEPPIARTLPIYVISALQNAIKKWADDTPGLLDHVYFETEPMYDVVKGDILDFTKAKMPEKVKHTRMKKLSKERLKEAKEIVANLSQKYATGFAEYSVSRRKAIIDQDYEKAIQYLNESDLDTGLTGIVEHNDI